MTFVVLIKQNTRDVLRVPWPRFWVSLESGTVLESTMKSDVGSVSLSGERISQEIDFLGPEELLGLTPAELTRRISELRPMIAAHAAAAERLHGPVDEVWQALRKAGFFYQFVPKHFGGLAVDFDNFVDACLPIAEACPSTGWVAAFCAGHNRIIANFPAEIQEELFGGAFPYVIAPLIGQPLGEAVKVDGGLRITGAWKWATGIMHADWIIAMVGLAQQGGPPQLRITLFPAAEAEVLDTWHPDGLAGTGSNDARVSDLFVPDKRVLSDVGILLSGRGSASRDYPEPIWSVPLITFNTLIASVPVLGAARGALQIFEDLIASRKRAGVLQAEQPVAQVRLAKADLMIASAEVLIREAGRRAVMLGDLEDPQQATQRIQIRAQIAYAASLCRKASLDLMEGAGSSVHMLDQPLQRFVRDIGIMSAHQAYDVDVAYELHGRALVGLQPNSFLF
jgi:alkylation response protein AidB-like acyl-CoA dehydrogenase